jgi:cell division septation protein DedD
MLIDHETRRKREEQMTLPVLEEPAWLEDELDEEMEAPSDPSTRGMWIGIAAAAITFVAVFAIPQWLGWYDVGPPPAARREVTPESVISTVTAPPSAETAPRVARVAAAPPAPASPAAAPPSSPPKAPAPRETKPAPPPVAAAPASAASRTFSVQIAAFKNAKQAGVLAARVKRDGYPADVQRIESPKAPWAVRVGGYATRAQAESARDALARKGLPGFIL